MEPSSTAPAPPNALAVPLASTLQTIVKIPSHKVVRGSGTPRFCESALARTKIFKQYLSGDPTVPANLITSVLQYEGMEEEILTSLGVDRFPMPFSPPSPPVYKIVQVEGFGLSMVATTNIARGQTIVIERPLFLYPQVVVVGNSMADALKLYEQVVDFMHPENREAVYAHKNAKGPEWPSHLKGILDTNSLGIGKLPGYPAMYTALARDISRVNHSCSPNACHSFDLATLTLRLRALAPIRAGEQVTLAYISLNRPRVERREELSRRYKFECMCTACNRREEDVCLSDFNRLLLKLRCMAPEVASDEEAFEKWLADGAPLEYAIKLLRTPEEMVHVIDSLNGFSRAVHVYALMEQENLFPSGLWKLVLARLVIGHSVLEQEFEVRKYALMAALLKKAETGSDGGWAAVVQNPRQTDWWGKRVKN